MRGWKQNKLHNLTSIVKGVQFNKLDLEKTGEYPCINGGIEPSGFSNKFNRGSNTIAISEGGNSCGHIKILRTKFWSGGHCYTLLNLSNEIENEFLYYALKGREKQIMGLRVGSGLPNIQQKAIKEFEITYPELKLEQSRIAEMLSTADDAIGQTERLIAKYQRIKTGLMQDLLTKGIDAKGNIRNKNTHRFIVKKGIEVPEDWDVDFLSKYAKIQGGNSFQSSDFANEGIQLIRIGNLYNNTFDLKRDPIFLPKDFQVKYDNFLLKEGDIIMSMTGTYGKRDYGFALMIPPNSKYLLNQRVCRFSYSANIGKDFLLLLLRSEYYLDQLFINVTGSKQGNLNTANILNVWVRIPKPEEQIKITEKIKCVENQITQLHSNLIKLNSIKTGLMQDLLSGRVRVKVKEEVRFE